MTSDKNYYKEIVECYENIPNTVVSTWEDEPEESIKYIESFGIHVILNKKQLMPQHKCFICVATLAYIYQLFNHVANKFGDYLLKSANISSKDLSSPILWIIMVGLLYALLPFLSS